MADLVTIINKWDICSIFGVDGTISFLLPPKWISFLCTTAALGSFRKFTAFNRLFPMGFNFRSCSFQLYFTWFRLGPLKLQCWPKLGLWRSLFDGITEEIQRFISLSRWQHFLNICSESSYSILGQKRLLGRFFNEINRPKTISRRSCSYRTLPPGGSARAVEVRALTVKPTHLNGVNRKIRNKNFVENAGRYVLVTDVARLWHLVQLIRTICGDGNS